MQIDVRDLIPNPWNTGGGQLPLRFRSSHSSEWRCVPLSADPVGAAVAEMAAGQRPPGSLLCWCHQKVM